MEKTLSKVVGQTIMQIAFIPGCNLSLKLQNSHSLDILFDKAFWRLSRENDIILTSDDFAVKTRDLFSHDYPQTLRPRSLKFFCNSVWL